MREPPRHGRAAARLQTPIGRCVEKLDPTTRARPLAPQGASAARGKVRSDGRPPGTGAPVRELEVTALQHAELASFLSALAAGGPDRPPVAPATTQRKAACLRSFYKIVQRHARAAGLEGKMSPHTLRHTFATHRSQAAATCARSLL